MTRNINNGTAAAMGTLVFLLSSGLAPVAPPTARAADDDGGTKLTQLDERMKALEKVVLDDPYKPKATVLARLEQIERQLADRDKADEKELKAVERTLGELQKAVEKSERLNEGSSRRIKALEEKGGGGMTSIADEVRKLRQDVNRAAASLEELKVRVSKLEAKK